MQGKISISDKLPVNTTCLSDSSQKAWRSSSCSSAGPDLRQSEEMALLCRVKVCVRPGTGDLKSKFMTVDGASSFIGIFEKIVGELSEDLAPRVGDLQRVTLTLGAEEAEPEESSDPVGKYFDMGLKVITFGDQKRAAEGRVPLRAAETVLLRAPIDGGALTEDTAMRDVHAPRRAESPARKRRAAVRPANRSCS